jgi:minimal PKS acyl carrier protein
MPQLTVELLREILEEVAGGDEHEWTEDSLDLPFDEIGYDSLALVGLVAKLRRDTGAVVPEEALVDMRTPRAAIDILNGYLAAPSRA